MVLVLAPVTWPVLPVGVPDIGAIFGPYTYFASEVAFGALAFALLYRADALRRAGVTVAVLYPIAYVWDWYTLTIGVFAIQLRTGVDFLGIPAEEHVFMVVVPALVVAFHETIHGQD
ncbi:MULTISPECIES: lycopene cyclase domain-containing protein [Halobacterium]|uniref:lycopene cyclase domain-containing protein n=1 Tax=Halobacterium TaxID=2239 RepID=UPI0009E6A7FA|nr:MULTISPECIES: lycopene cyclase domain-containing protein [Halobacterium]MCG1003797.1 lycopene cyclase domain-containing protein [Halobacterium noricense]